MLITINDLLITYLKNGLFSLTFYATNITSDGFIPPYCPRPSWV